VTIAEPVTTLTDYALAVVCAVLGWKLVSASKLWAAAFLALAAAALLGGTWHGFVQSDLLWKATVLSVGIASFAMIAGSAREATRGFLRTALVFFAGLKLAAYTGWMLRHDDFIWVVADTAIALVAVGLLHLWKLNRAMLAGVVLSFLAGAVQASGLALHEHFNHNDLYHLIQIAAMFAFYRGVRGFSEER
jgi:hypothetical protein